MSVVASMDLKFENYCKVEQSPTTVLPSPRYAKHESRIRKGIPASQNDKTSLDAGFREINIRNYHRSVSCKSLQARNNELSVDTQVLKRGCSVYQSSKERKPLRRLESIRERKKIQVSLGNAPFSFSLLDSICGSDEEKEEEERLTVESSRQSSCVKFDIRERDPFRPAERDILMENPKFKSHQVDGPLNNSNILNENDNKPKVAVSHSAVLLDGYGSKNSPKSRFTSIRKMFDPLTKSKSHRIPSKSNLESKTTQKSSLSVSTVTTDMDCGEHVKKHRETIVQFHGDLRLEHKHGVPYFELSLSHSEDIFVAKTWKSEDTLNWVYTFHSVQGRKRSNASGSGMKYSNKNSPIIGQMQVSGRLLSELKDGGAFSDSMVTEFVLYDIMHGRKIFASNERLDYSSPYPWASADLDPCLETAAVVIQIPFKKRESLKYSSGDKFSRQVQLSRLDLSQKRTSGVSDGMRTRVNVVTPTGNHSLPDCESRGPLPLLDRWRLGGGCDCGGWDMACPVVVFSNLSMKQKEEQPFLQQDRPFDLHVQGAKQKTPALSINCSGKGKYAVDFHAQLSTLQAFAICVAMLHATEVSTKADQEKNTKGNDQKALVEDEVKILIDSVREKTGKVRKTVENHPSFKLDPPFSPISRV